VKLWRESQEAGIGSIPHSDCDATFGELESNKAQLTGGRSVSSQSSRIEHVKDGNHSIMNGRCARV